MNRRTAAVFVSVVTLLPSAARAVAPASSSSAAPAPPPAPAASASAAPAADALDRAKDLFRKGNELMKAGDMEAALDYFLRSRALVPSVPNTMNAAIALDRLDRADEALDFYERLFTDFAGKLEDEDKRSVASAMAALRKRVGSVDVSANVDGALVIDGRRRGSLPLTNPVAVRPGKHLVRVLKEGFAPGEAEVTVAIGQNVAVDLKLSALAASGRLAVTETGGRTDVDVFVDGAPVGVAPWQGTLSPGRHLVSLGGKTLGSAPTAATVVVGQTVPVSLTATPIGPPLRLDPDPRSASLVLDGTDLGVGPWEGRLPLGKHRVDASEEGYLVWHADIDGASKGSVAVRLEIDENHPRWRKLEESKIRLEAFGGLAFGTSLGGSAEAACPGSCASHSSPSGFLVGARGAYVVPSGLRAEVSAGFLGVSSSATRTIATSEPYSYRFHDDISVSGPFVAAGIGYGLKLAPIFHLTGRASVGAFFARSRDTISATVVRGAEEVPASVDQGGSAARGIDVFVMPELGGELHFGAFHVGLTLGAGIFLVDGPALSHGETTVQSDCPHTTGTGAIPLGCVPGSNVVAGEHAYHRFILWMPQLGAGWTF